ncbi:MULTISPECIES: hypothetical protein [unclassified Campylobacter]|uniref:hypothetical protein n=1 Tax=unclassified Campylobacter TaxID=2593542 RepID=UPI0012383882|nr:MULTISPECIES: hypothetical protein [unclassified Campylobacter]KAA6225903.1 hypothetical protein FMM54_05635 [Campylobacter sp. LR185c]KAA6227027.1 hypothetical protein FMM55_03490 [Campylobacter sp. LR196d]KAA6227598.1 hypothetical protein FMM57_04035 [Campylobacter sp. LR286c]KAA6229463.1 hypothetical protein FMM56_07910 [Campylobacter sp. LR264d]KAA6230708.1 hypothetical protein FMM58_04665 [Campylobacter sp. LR291e]
MKIIKFSAILIAVLFMSGFDLKSVLNKNSTSSSSTSTSSDITDSTSALNYIKQFINDKKPSEDECNVIIKINDLNLLPDEEKNSLYYKALLLYCKNSTTN